MSAQIPRDRFSWNLILETFIKIWWENPYLVEMGQKCHSLYMKTQIRGLSGKFPNISRKNFPVLPWSYSALSPSTYSPLLCMHRCQRFFNVMKHSWKAVLGMLCRCASEFVLIASIDSKLRPFSVDLTFGNRTKSAGARSGEYGACGRTVVACLAKNSRTRNDDCDGALSCWSIHRFFRHASGLFFLTASRRRCITSR